MSSWSDVLKEAQIIIEKDIFMNSIITSFILNHSTFSSAISFSLAQSFDGIIPFIQWHNLYVSVLSECNEYEKGMETLEEIGLLDLIAISLRDPASEGLVNPFLNFKGYKALQAHRIAHVLWKAGRKDTARAIQSRCSELFAVDIHPAAVIGKGLMIDHGTGVVIGETAVVGKNCSFLHGVTLGSTGKEKGDRHPKIGDDVLIGCNTTVLGNISIGCCCKIGSGSIVLKSLPKGLTAVGNPARVVGKSLCPSASMGMDVALEHVQNSQGVAYSTTWSMYVEGENYADGI